MPDHPLLQHFTEHETHYFAPSIPYKFPFPHALQTLSLWIPKGKFSREHLVVSDPDDLWIIYIHGGAWRDPKITSLSFSATAEHLLSPSPSSSSSSSTDGEAVQKPHIAALASLNYSLSPHPDHPESTPDDPLTRRASHPQHIRDVLTALRFLHATFPGSLRPRRHVLLGHSCGATLALQTLMPPARLVDSYGAQASLAVAERGDERPAAVVPIAGLYDLPALVEGPGEKHEALAPVYRAFLRGAFGADESVWARVSPTRAAGFEGGEYEPPGMGWGPGEMLVVFAQSRGDSLVPWSQMEGMRGQLEARGWREAHLQEAGSAQGARWWKVQEVQGDHNYVWEDGRELAKVVLRTMMWVRARIEGEKGRQ